jgi:hypothetical protein
MRNWIGLASLLVAAWLLYVGTRQRNRVMAPMRDAQTAGATAQPLHPSLVFARDLFRPLVIGALIFLAIKTTAAYLLLDGNRFFSWFDLVGFLLFLAAYGAWLVLKTSYRDVPTPVVTAAAPEPMRVAERVIQISPARELETQLDGQHRVKANPRMQAAAE